MTVPSAPTAILARWAAEWPGEAPAEAVERARIAIYDTLACMVAGAGDESAARVRAAVSPWGEGPATVIGSTRQAAAPWAALANGTAAHALDYDDGLHLGPAHISAVLVPALLALAEERGASGRRLLEAYIVGIEVLTRVALGVGRSHYEKGWHATSTLGTIAAAAAAGRLLGLDAAAMGGAIGLATSMASGTKAQFGSPAKPLHAGMAAQNGVLAATLAAAGLTAAAEPLDAKLGFRRVYGGEDGPGWGDLKERLDGPLAILEHGVGAKFYPCCRATHRTLDGVLELRRRHGFAAAEVAAVETVVGFSSAQNLMYPDPQNEMQARFSMPYCVAVALAHGRISLSDFTPEAVARPEIRQLMGLVRMEGMAPSKLDISPEKRKPALVRIALKDGHAFETAVQHALGTAARPMNGTQISEKFGDCTLGFLSPRDRAAAEEALKGLGQAETVAPLMACLSFEAAADRGQRFARRAAE